MTRLKQARSSLHLDGDTDEERIRDCKDLLQSLKDNVDQMHEQTPKILQSLYHDIRDLVGELRQLLPE